MNLELKQFKNINLDDSFFCSLKADYAEFSQWFAKKSEDHAYVFYGDAGQLDGFLYLKVEHGAIDDVSPPLPPQKRLKVGTMKINPHGTRLGERFVKKIFDHAVFEQAAEIYVTVFAKHEALVGLFSRYGFKQKAEKSTRNGTEVVLVRALDESFTDVVEGYPLVQLNNAASYLLALYPQWHTRLLPDSILKNENASIVQDISHTNSIHKVYLAAMPNMERLKRGDLLLIYRTSDEQGPAHYRSVATSICVVEEYRSIHSFSTKEAFLGYCRPYSVFSEAELERFWRERRYPHVVRFTYNIALPKRVTRGEMIEQVGLDEGARWGFLPITNEQLINIARRGMVDESLIIH